MLLCFRDSGRPVAIPGVGALRFLRWLRDAFVVRECKFPPTAVPSGTPKEW